MPGRLIIFLMRSPRARWDVPDGRQTSVAKNDGLPLEVPNDYSGQNTVGISVTGMQFPDEPVAALIESPSRRSTRLRVCSR